MKGCLKLWKEETESGTQETRKPGVDPPLVLRGWNADGAAPLESSEVPWDVKQWPSGPAIPLGEVKTNAHTKAYTWVFIVAFLLTAKI